MVHFCLWAITRAVAPSVAVAVAEARIWTAVIPFDAGVARGMGGGIEIEIETVSLIVIETGYGTGTGIGNASVNVKETVTWTGVAQIVGTWIAATGSVVAMSPTGVSTVMTATCQATTGTVTAL